MGTVFGAALQRIGHDVAFLGRSPGCNAGRYSEEITLVSREGITDRIQFNVAQHASVVSNADLLIVLVKTPDTDAAIDRVASFLSPETTIVTLQNGLRAADRIRDRIGRDMCVIPGVTSQAATRSGSHVVHTGTGPTQIGSDGARARTAASWIAGLLTEAGLPTTVSDSIEREIWQKAAINAAINGPTALSGTVNGAIAAMPDLRQLAVEVASETARVAASQGFLLSNIENGVIDTANATATNRSSMLQDIDAGRPTEADAIYGEIQRAARLAGVPTPRIDALFALVKARSRAAGPKERSIEQHA